MLQCIIYFVMLHRNKLFKVEDFDSALNGLEACVQANSPGEVARQQVRAPERGWLVLTTIFLRERG